MGLVSGKNKQKKHCLANLFPLFACVLLENGLCVIPTHNGILPPGKHKHTKHSSAVGEMSCHSGFDSSIPTHNHKFNMSKKPECFLLLSQSDPWLGPVDPDGVCAHWM